MHSNVACMSTSAVGAGGGGRVPLIRIEVDYLTEPAPLLGLAMDLQTGLAPMM